MNDASPRNTVSAPPDGAQRRIVPGPRSKAIFDREAEAMAPGLQSIALYSQIAVDHASGCTITDVDGNEYLDFIAGIAVGSLGHCHPHYVKRMKEQLERVTFGSFTTETRANFLNLVSGLLPEGITHIQLFSGGAEAVEAAFRLAKSVSKKFEFVGFWGGYHGKTAGVIGLLGGAYRNHQGPFPPGMHLSPYANCYRCPWKLQYPSCGLACAEHLRNVIKNDTQGEVAAIVLEPMQATAGNVIPVDDFIHAVREIADEFGALLIVDEILTGFGRTGTMWGCDQFDLKPDIMTIGKGIGGGFPLSGVASSFDRMSAKPFGEPSGSSSSYGGNPLAAAAGLGVVEAILEEKLVENSARVGALMLDALKRLQDKYRFIGDVRGRGLMIGIEMVADRTTKAPLDRTITRALFHEALERGLITMSYSHVIRINPPLIIGEDEATRGVDLLDQSFAAISRRFGLE
ncbi:MAG: aspartate aminotransferase family protein [Hyphomicrobiales bacterium]|nr:aspartate aminotransferase family protein [Hyphomicrobiales bacterium]MBV8440005.1 aspartate aminotransferase family protein [Hyphomicrobiales bacterium]